MADREEASFELDHGSALEALREKHGRCPEPEVLVAWAKRSLVADTEEHRQIELHLASCVACLEVVETLEGTLDRADADSAGVDDVTWARVEEQLDRRAAPWRSSSEQEAPRRDWSALAARLAAVLLLGALLGVSGIYLSQRGPGGPGDAPVSTERGGQIQIVGPIGEIERLETFEWSWALPGALIYRVEIERDGELLWSEFTDQGAETRMVAPPELAPLLAGGSAKWRVIGLSPSGSQVARSPWVELRIRESASPQP